MGFVAKEIPVVPFSELEKRVKMKIATVGDNCVDVYRKLNKSFLGGNPVNVAVYFVRQGGEASYTGVVGNDANGRMLKNALIEKRVDISHLRTVEGDTAVTYVDLVNGERVFGDYFEGVLADFKLSKEDIDFLASQDMVVSGLWGMIENDLYRIKEKGVPITFDFATKLNDPIVDKAIPFVDYVFFAYDGEDWDFIKSYMKQQHSRGPKLVITTLGEKGSLCFDGESFHTFGIIPTDVIDTMGAGDSYIAGFLGGILSKQKIEECMRLGAVSSSITLKHMGAW